LIVFSAPICKTREVAEQPPTLEQRVPTQRRADNTRVAKIANNNLSAVRGHDQKPQPKTAVGRNTNYRLIAKKVIHTARRQKQCMLK
jgi:hypothetical protein